MAAGAVYNVLKNLNGYREVREKVTSDVAPGADDDSTQYYVKGSTWVDVVGEKVWYCTDPAEGAAVWLGVTIA